MQRFWSNQKGFWSNQKGSMIVMFAVALIPILALMGAAIDYSRASLARTKMQAALDATALFLSRLPGGTTLADLNTKGTQFFFANYTETDVLNILLTITPALTPGKMNLSAYGVYNPIMVNVAGITSFPVGTKTEVKWGNSRLRVSLVLDVTGSMSSAGKMTALKTAAKNLLGQLKDAATTNGDVYVSIIPFSKDVAVDPANWNANWVKFDWLEPNGTEALNSWDALRRHLRVRGHNCMRNAIHQPELLRGSPSLQVLEAAIHRSDFMPEQRRHLVEHADLLLHGRLDPQRPQHLERLHHGPRQGSGRDRRLRHEEHGAEPAGLRHAVPGRAIFLLPGEDDGPDLRLDRAEPEDRRARAGRQHQPGRSDWHGAGSL